MTTVIHDEFRITNLQKFIASLGSGNSLYLGIGRVQAWGVPDTPPIPSNTYQDRLKDWEDLCSMKLITSSDVITGIVKELWTPNVKYDQYRHDWGISGAASVYNPNLIPTSLVEAKYYVINTSGDIFVCLKQGRIDGVVQPSIYSPETGTVISANAGIYKTADGYYWKFIANTTTADTVKFQTSQYTPIRTLVTPAAPTDQNYNQWLSQQNSASFKRGIYAINILTAGAGYNGGVAGTSTHNDSTFKVVGNGTGLQYTVSYGSGGTVVGIEITNPGSGYTYASFTSTSGSGCVIDIVYTPDYGLGTDPVKDLSATYLMINTRLQGAEGSGDFFVDNDFRKICLIMNPTNYGTSTIATATTLDALLTLTVTGASGINAFGADGVVTDQTTGAKAVIVDWNSSTSKLRVLRSRDAFINTATPYTNANASFQVGNVLSSTSGTPPYGNVSAVTPPEVEPYSGSIVYSEYRLPLIRSTSQTEVINIIVQF